jgi:DNA-binding transcriptional LysR family regulator
METLLPGPPLVALVPAGHALAAKQVLGPDDLRAEQLVTWSRSTNPALHDSLLRSIEEAGYSFAHMRDVGGPMLRDVLVAVAAGDGVAILPRTVTETGDGAGVVAARALDPPLSMSDTVIAWRANPPRHLGTVIRAIRGVARDMRDDRPRP